MTINTSRMLKKLSYTDSFNIEGDWGNDSCSLGNKDFQGYLKASDKKYQLIIHDDFPYINGFYDSNGKMYKYDAFIDDNYPVIGKGLLTLYKDSKIYRSIVWVSLNISYITNTSINDDKVRVYKVNTLILGNHLYNVGMYKIEDDIEEEEANAFDTGQMPEIKQTLSKHAKSIHKINDLSLYITNFTNFLFDSLISSKSYLINKNNNSIQLIYNPKNLPKFELNNNIIFKLCNNYKYVLNSSDKFNNYIGFKLVYYIKLLNINADKEKIYKYQMMISQWLSLLTNSYENVYRSVGYTKNIGYYNFIYSNSFGIKSKIVNRMHYLKTYGGSWLKDIFNSLKTWISLYESLNIIYGNLNISNVGTIDQRLQNICVDFQMIYDFYYKNHDSNRKNHPNCSYFNGLHYKTSVILKAIYSKLDNTMENKCSLILTKMPIIIKKKSYNKDNINIQASKIVHVRNCLSHNVGELNSFILNDRIKLLNILRFLINDWILHKIGIKSQYLSFNHYEYMDPFNILECIR